MDFVNDYITKSKLADQLRKRQQAMLNADIDTGPLVTQASGAFPGQVQANPWANLAKLGSAYFAGQAGKNATAAEEEAQSSRMQALQALTTGGAGAQGAGNGPAQPGALGGAGGTMSPEQVINLQRLGVTPAEMKLMIPKAEAIGAIAQAAGTRQGRAFLVASGRMTSEQKDSIDAEEQAGNAQKMKDKQQEYLFEQANKTFAPTQGRGETEIEFAQRDPEGFARYQQQKAAAKGSTSDYDKKAQQEQAKADVAVAGGAPKVEAGIKRIDSMISDNEKNPYTVGSKYRMADAASHALTGIKASDFDPKIQVQEQAAKQFHLDAMEQMRGFGQVTENEQKLIEATQFDRYDTPEARTQKLKVIRGALQSGLDKVNAARERLKNKGGNLGTVRPHGGGTMKSPGGVSYSVEDD